MFITLTSKDKIKLNVYRYDGILPVLIRPVCTPKNSTYFWNSVLWNIILNLAF